LTLLSVALVWSSTVTPIEPPVPVEAPPLNATAPKPPASLPDRPTVPPVPGSGTVYGRWRLTDTVTGPNQPAMKLANVPGLTFDLLVTADALTFEITTAGNAQPQRSALPLTLTQTSDRTWVPTMGPAAAHQGPAPVSGPFYLVLNGPTLEMVTGPESATPTRLIFRRLD